MYYIMKPPLLLYVSERKNQVRKCLGLKLHINQYTDPLITAFQVLSCCYDCCTLAFTQASSQIFLHGAKKAVEWSLGMRLTIFFFFFKHVHTNQLPTHK